MTSKRIAKKASKVLRKAKKFTVREVAGSDLAQAGRRVKRAVKRARRRTTRR